MLFSLLVTILKERNNPWNNTMKKLLFLFLLPALVFCQTYDEIIKITSQDLFVRYMVENGYERDEPTELRALAVANIVSFFEHQRDLYHFCNDK